MKHWNNFISFVKRQFEYGGKKYRDVKGSTTREATDVLFDKHTYRWLIGTVDKYTFRYRNLAREKDILKISCYMYIIWLKRGFFVQPNGVATPIDTNLEIKIKNFDLFCEKAKDFYAAYEKEIPPYQDKMAMISNILSTWSTSGWESIKEAHIFQIFCFGCFIWGKKFGNKKEHDEDVNNEDKKK